MTRCQNRITGPVTATTTRMPVIDAAIITMRLGEIGGFNVVLTPELSRRAAGADFAQAKGVTAERSAAANC